MNRPQAKLVRAIEQGYFKTYIFSCVDCGKEFVRSANNKRINPYCGECQRKYDRIRNAENKAKRQAEHNKQIRAEVIAEISREMRLLYGNEYEKQIRADAIEEVKQKILSTCSRECIKCDFCKDETCDVSYIAEQLKEQNK